MTQKYSHERYLKVGDVHRTLAKWAEETGLTKARIAARLMRDWTPEQAVGQAPGPREQRRLEADALYYTAWGAKHSPTHVKHTVYGFTGSMTGIAERFRKDASTLERRLKRGWTLEEAVAIGQLPGKWTIEFAREQPFYQWLMNETKCSSPTEPAGTQATGQSAG